MQEGVRVVGVGLWVAIVGGEELRVEGVGVNGWGWLECGARG